VVPRKDNELARRFDYLMYSIELARLQSRNADKNINAVVSAAEKLERRYAIPQVREQRYVIEKVLGKGFWDNAEILDLEGVREALRDLIQFLDRTDTKIYYTDFTDNITSLKE